LAALFLLGLALSAGGCHAGVGPQLAARDFANAFAYRDQSAIEAISTLEFRAAVWDRLKPDEFKKFAEMMGRGQDGELVDTQFQDKQALIVVRTPTRQQYRIFVVYQGDQWLVNDVLRERAPSDFYSLRKQAEAMLAVRDFREAVLGGDLAAVQQASSKGLSDEVWQRISPELMRKAGAFLNLLEDTSKGDMAVLSEQKEGRSAVVKGALGEHRVDFVTERGRLVIDDISLPGSKKSLRVRLRLAIAVRDWIEDR
jgi:hypothetical protein